MHKHPSLPLRGRPGPSARELVYCVWVDSSDDDKVFLFLSFEVWHKVDSLLNSVSEYLRCLFVLFFFLIQITAILMKLVK